ncbi:hypothetical protein HDV01_005492 [Terramyces sp. JEL0728]|nr:hypothetical protein HDV01_005492 [Terramyces sp. JEL0728]
MRVELDPIQHLDIYNSIKSILNLKKQTLSFLTQYESKEKLEHKLKSLLKENQGLLLELNTKKTLIQKEELKDYETTLLQHKEYGKKLQNDLQEMLIDLRLSEYELDLINRIEFQERQLKLFPELDIKKVETVCTLWSGYGTIYRFHLPTKTLICKHINPPRDNSVSHQRKLKSYQNELAFYQLEKPNHPPLPEFISSPKPNCYLLSDISVEYPFPSGDLATKELELALSWLAKFHSYWFKKVPFSEKGSYWHVDTRQQELQQMKNKKLQSIAQQLDEQIHSSKFKTLIHGDFKSENIQFNDSSCVVYDYQYAGSGLGAQDVCYLLTSSARDTNSIDKLLAFYFSELTIDGYTYDQFLQDFDLCLLDYIRFMDGWGYWGNSRWAVVRTRELLGSY